MRTLISTSSCARHTPEPPASFTPQKSSPALSYECRPERNHHPLYTRTPVGLPHAGYTASRAATLDQAKVYCEAAAWGPLDPQATGSPQHSDSRPGDICWVLRGGRRVGVELIPIKDRPSDYQHHIPHRRHQLAFCLMGLSWQVFEFHAVLTTPEGSKGFLCAHFTDIFGGGTCHGDGLLRGCWPGLQKHGEAPLVQLSHCSCMASSTVHARV
jgi:hypothetical protein